MSDVYKGVRERAIGIYRHVVKMPGIVIYRMCVENECDHCKYIIDLSLIHI